MLKNENPGDKMNRDLFNLIIGRPGGKNTMRIIDEILVKPQNANQLSKKLNLDYKTIIHHTKIMCNHNFVIREKFESYYYYHPSKKLIKNLDEYKLIKEKFLEK